MIIRRLNKRLNKKAVIFDIPFSMLFAIIAGVIIILLAVFATIRFVKTSQYSGQSESAKALLNILNPVVNDITSAYAPAPIKFNKETRIYLGCSVSSEKSKVFGKQTLAFSEKSSVVQRWPSPGANVSRYNKYIFSDKIEQGKTLYVFSKPFYTGFKVDDLVIMSMKNYCFVSSPNFIKEEVLALGIKNINISDDISKCSSKEVKVCFGFSQSECNISVQGTCSPGLLAGALTECDKDLEGYDFGYVERLGKKNYYVGSLIYAAIFSSPEIYECNVKRLENKINELAKVYKDKIDILKSKNCNTIIGIYIDEIIGVVANAGNSSLRIGDLFEPSSQMDKANCEDSVCRVYNPEKC